MKKLTALTVLFALCLTSCTILRDEDGTDATLPIKDAEAVQTADGTSADLTDASETTAVSETETEAVSEPKELPSLVGLYDDLQNNGTYTRLDTWNVPWASSVDIAVFDVIPSGEAVIYNASYKDMWQAEAAKLATLPKPYLILEYTLDDGSVRRWEIRAPSDAEAVIAEGYIEVYLYDDIHQPDGAWYSHLTAADMTDKTVISSVKLTAGDAIGAVTQLKLTACLDGSADAAVVLTNG